MCVGVIAVVLRCSCFALQRITSVFMGANDVRGRRLMHIVFSLNLNDECVSFTLSLLGVCVCVCFFVLLFCAHASGPVL